MLPDVRGGGGVVKLGRPLPQRGPVAARWEAHRRRSRLDVMARCRNACEACGAKSVPLELHHCMGRRHLVSEPLASSPELTTALCPDCHRAITRGTDLELSERVLWAAADRLAGVRHAPALAILRLDGCGALDALRTIVGQVEAEEEG